MLSWLKHQVHRLFDSTQANHHVDLEAFKQTLGYDFSDHDLFVQALKHRSYLSVSSEARIHSNERLELLGDAVLDLVVVEFLYHRFPDKEEGDLTSMKSLIVSRRILARIARAMELGQFILMSESEEKSGGRSRASINSDALEAIIGAIYLDGGLEKARDFIDRKILCHFDEIMADELHTNFKSMLLEYAQSQNIGTPCYHVRSVEGPDHEKVFTIQVTLRNEVLGLGTATSKKRAEQLAAQEALKNLYLI